MLKHLSSRSDSRNSILSDLDASHVDDVTTPNTTLDEHAIEPTNGDVSQEYSINRAASLEENKPEDGISILLTKPTIKRIIERRKSELFLKETLNISLTENNSIQEEDFDEKKKEIIEEVQKENSKLIIYRRKRELSDDTSSESGIASQISETPNDKNKQNEDETDSGDLLKSSQKDFWKLEEDIPPPPLAFSSPTRSLKEKNKESSSFSDLSHIQPKNRLNDIREDPHGYTTLDGRYRNKPSHSNKRRQRMQYIQHPHHHQDMHIKQPGSHCSELPITTMTLDRRHTHLNPQHMYTKQSGSHCSEPPIATMTLDRRHTRLNSRPIAPKYQRLHSVQPDMFRHNPYSSVNNLSNTASARSNTLLTSSERGYNINPRSHSEDLRRNFNRKDKHRGSSYSISAGSSVSNVIPPSESCSCGTMSRRGVLEKISEEMELQHQAFNHSYEITQNRIQKCKYFTLSLVVCAAVVCLVAGLLHFYIGHFPQEFSLNQGDVQLIKMSSLFCGSIKGISDDSGVRLITFKNNNELRKTIVYTRHEEITVSPSSRKWMRDFYLLQGSSIKIIVETTASLDVLFFRSKKDYTIWSERKESETYAAKMECCVNKRTKKGELNVKAERDGYYVIALYYSPSETNKIIVSIDLEFKRVTYDFARTTSSCTAEETKSCSAEYVFNAGDEVAVEVPLVRQYNKISTSADIKWACEARIWFYCVLFIVVYVVVIATIFGSYYVSIKFLIPSEKCCCIKGDKKRQTKTQNNEIVYYDNEGKTNSDISTNQNFDSISNKQTPNGCTELTSMYADETLRTNESVQYIRNLFQNQYQAAPLPRTSRPSSAVSNSLAVIYSKSQPYVDTADSGISVEPDLSPTGQPSVNAHNVMHLQELQFQRLKAMRHQQIELADSPRVKQLLYRPRSVMSKPIYQVGHTSQHFLDLCQENNNQRINDYYDMQPQEPVPYIQTRPKSVMSEGDYYRYAGEIPSEHMNLETINDSKLYV